MPADQDSGHSAFDQFNRQQLEIYAKELREYFQAERQLRETLEEQNRRLERRLQELAALNRLFQRLTLCPQFAVKLVEVVVGELVAFALVELLHHPVRYVVGFVVAGWDQRCVLAVPGDLAHVHQLVAEFP